MQIVQVDLENVKSYAQASIPFGPGINAICGQNGAGKSTLLEAIGFALFDYLQVTKAEFVREGERTATVTVRLVGADERLYHVVRKCGSTNQIYVYDPELEQKLVEGKGDTLDWLHEFLGVDEATNLTTLFRDAVGVPQGLLTVPFLLAAGPRTKVFNPLLRVDEYETAWKTLGGTRSWLEKRLQDYDRQIAGLGAETRILPQREADAAALAEALAAGEARQAELVGVLAEVGEHKAELEAISARLDELKRAVLRAEVEQQTFAARLNEAQVGLRRAEAAQAIVADTEEGHQVYLAAQAELELLETQRQERDAVRAERQQVEKQLAQTEERLATLVGDLEAIAQAEAEMSVLHPKVEEQERVEAALVEARRAVDRLSAAQEALTEAEARLIELRERGEQVRAGVIERQKVEAELAGVQAALEPLDSEHTALVQALAAQQAELKGLVTQQEQAAIRVKQGERDLAREQAHLVDLERELKRLQDGTTERAQVDAGIAAGRIALEALDTDRTVLTEVAAGHKAALEQVGTQLQVLMATESGRCPVCEGPLTPEHRAALLEGQQARQAELEVALTAAQAEQQIADKARRKQEKALRTLEDRLKTLPRPEEVQTLEGQVATQRQADTERGAAVTQALADVAALQVRRAELEVALEEVQAHQTVLEAARAAKREACEGLGRRLRALPRPDEVEDLAEQCIRQEATVEGKAMVVAELAGAPDEVARWEQMLATLDDPRKAYQGAGAIAGRRIEVEQRRAEAEGRQHELMAALAGQAETLAAYAGLDDRLAAQRVALVENEPAHRRYLEHIREATALAERQAAAAALSEQAEAAQARYADQVAARDAVAQEYDPDIYAEVAARYATLGQDLAGLVAQLGEQRKQQAQLLAEIARLHEVQAALDTVAIERAEHLELLALLDTLRRALREAGPEITKALVALVSLQADRLYADIMQDTSARLCWTDDYDIQLRAEGRTRVFQQLSGGEQMAAALAVRLALLREISAIDVAFFDEPTANLDRDRRANLAAQILNIKGFSQLFVISHDDTFEQDTDHAVHIVKHNGTSEASSELDEWAVG
ncbi:MAG: SMC family ATPase [Anaerolineae bacterium]|nr:SMC family ATPase [Anaerolineae bacterium]